VTTTVEVLPATENVTVEVDPLTGAITLELTAPDIVLYVNEGVPGGVDTTSIQTLTNKTLASPAITGDILDANGNELLKLTATASAVNELTLANAATAGNPTLTASGGDANISINLVPKGAGTVMIGGVAMPAPVNIVDLTTAQTLTNKTLTAPKVGTGISDTNGNELLLFTATASAVNELTYANAATGNAPSFSASGNDTNIDINLAPKGTGVVKAGGVAVATAGLQTCWIPAGAMISRSTNGAASGTVEMTTNKNMFKTLDFDTATSEYAQFAIQMPKSWNEGTVTAAFVWSHAATATNFGVVWSLAGVALSNDDAGDVAFGTEQTGTDTGGTTNDIYVSPATAAITIAGTPAANDYVMFQVSRVVANGSDTMAIDARLHGVQLYYTTDAATDA
jgi:hypothetical protein